MNPPPPTTRQHDHGDIVPWNDLSDGQRERFLASYTSTAACEERAKHATEAKKLHLVLMLQHISLTSSSRNLCEKMGSHVAKICVDRYMSGKPMDPDKFTQQLIAEANLKQVQEIVSKSEKLISQTVLNWIWDGNSKALKWLSDLVKAHPTGDFKAENTRSLKPDDLKSVIVCAFVALTDCSETSLLFGGESHPERLPTKKALDSYVMGKFAWKEKGGKDPLDNFHNQIQRCRKALGLDGLPESSEVK